MVCDGFPLSAASSTCRKTVFTAAYSSRTRRRSAVCSSVKTAQIPNGLEVDYISRDDVPFLYREVFEENLYDRPPVQLCKGDIVVDVGANIGFFSMYAAAKVGSKGRVLALEPIPRIFQTCTNNIQRHKAWAQQQGLPVAPVTLLNYGVSDGSRDAAEFAFYTKAAGWSSMYPQPDDVAADMSTYLDNSLQGMKGMDSLAAHVAQLAQQHAPALYQIGWRVAVDSMLRSAQSVTCPLVTLSHVIRDHNLPVINLLKVDVERAELDVLCGIEAQHWPKVIQVVMEVHDEAGRLERVVKLMAGHGFNQVVVEQDECLVGSQLYNLYCTRY